MTRLISVLSIAALLSGCATYGDIRTKAPAHAETVAGLPAALADCALDQLQMKYATGIVGGSTFQKIQVGNTIHIGEQLNGFFGPQNFQWDMTFEPAAEGETSIQLRAISDVWGRPQAQPDLWDIVRACSRSA